MNCYFLLEDSKSFIKIFPEWLKFIGFKSTRVADITCVEENNYILQSGCGVTQLITCGLFATIDTIINSNKRIDSLVVILDSEEETVQARKRQVIEKIAEKYDARNLNFEIKIFVCNCCIETWLLGRKNMYPLPIESNPNAENYKCFSKHFENHYYHYNIEINDPELMSIPDAKSETKARYHFHYFHDLCLYNFLSGKSPLKYTKSKPNIAMNEDFFDGLMERIYDTDDLESLKEFVCFLKSNT